MEEHHKNLLSRNLVKLTNDLNPRDIYDQLIQGGIFTYDDIEMISNMDTRREKALQLIKVLHRKGPKAFDVFRDALKSSYPHLYELLTADMSSADTTFKDLRCELEERYNDKLKCLYPMAWRRDKPLRLREVYVKRHLIKITASGETKVDIDDVFTPDDDQEIPKRILIEGDPGVGKTTLCQYLAYAWSSQACTDRCGRQCIHSFDLVFHLHAGCFNASVTDTIKSMLLPFDFKISSRSLEEILQSSAVLFLLDAYDETGKENQILENLIEKKILRKSTLLLTSRSNFLRDKLHSFDSRFSLEAYDAHQQLDHVKRLAEYMSFPVAPFDSLLENDGIEGLCHNPLYLTLLCMLDIEESCSLRSRTQLYSCIHRSIAKKALMLMKLTQEEMERQIMLPLYKLAFDMYQRKENSIHERDIRNVSPEVEKIVQVGYLTKDVAIKDLQEEIRYCFIHRTFLEFLSAKHIKLQTQYHRQAWLETVYQLPAVPGPAFVLVYTGDTKSSPHAQDKSVVAFLFGLSEEDPEALTHMATIVMNLTFFSLLHPFVEYNVCEGSHVTMELLCELNRVHPALGDVVIKRCPSHVSFGYNCSAECVKGMIIICNLKNMRPRSISLDVSHIKSYPSNHMSLLKQLVKYKSIDWIEISPEDSRQLIHCLVELQVGREDSIKNVKIKKSQRSASKFELPPDELQFGDDLRELTLVGFENLSTNRFLESVSSKPLTKLQIQHCQLDNISCQRLLPQLLLNKRLKDVCLLSGHRHMGQFLGRLASLPYLRGLDVCLKEMDSLERKLLEAILKKKTIQRLGFHRCVLSGDICALLSSNLSGMTSLQELEINDSFNIFNYPSIDPILRSLSHVNLQKLTLSYALSDKDVFSLAKAIPLWPSLQELKIIDVSLIYLCEPICPMVQRYEHTETATRSLIEAITGRHRLENLWLRGIQVNDTLVPDLCTMFASLDKLNSFNIFYIWDDSLTKAGITILHDCLKTKREKVTVVWEENRIHSTTNK